jgi:ADP-ribose 1''-phosphate phosphatase
MDSVPTISATEFHLLEETGDLFEAPPTSILIHACNCAGSWGGGIATMFKDKYPQAFKLYNKHCKQNQPADLVGTALLIAPCETSGSPHWIGCVFTSKKFGQAKDKPNQILKATESAMRHLLQQIASEGSEKIGGIYMCRINSGKFGVPWKNSKAILEKIQVDMKGMSGDIHVIRPPEEEL